MLFLIDERARGRLLSVLGVVALDLDLGTWVVGLSQTGVRQIMCIGVGSVGVWGLLETRN